MKLFIESLMIFLGTLMTAALVALGEPANAEVALAQAAPAVLEQVILPVAIDAPRGR